MVGAREHEVEILTWPDGRVKMKEDGVQDRETLQEVGKMEDA